MSQIVPSIAVTTLVDPTDTSKTLSYDLSGASSGMAATLTFPITASRVITFPDATDTVATIASSQTLSNKTISGASNTFTNIPASSVSSGTIAIANGGTNSTTALNNNSIMVSSAGKIVEAAALTNGQLLIGSTGAAPVAAAITGTTNQITVTNAAGSITLATPQNINTAATPTFASETLTATTNQLVLGTTNTTTITSTAPAASRTYTIVDAGGADSFAMIAATQTLTNKSLTNAGTFFVDGTNATKRVTFQSSGATASTTLTLASVTTVNRVLTFPNATDTLAALALAQTFTNKSLNNTNNFFVDGTTPSKQIGFSSSGASATTTLTLASICTANRTVTFPDATDTVVNLASVQSMTNKSMTDSSNNVTAKGLFSATTTVNVGAATAPTAGQLLTATAGTTATWQTPITGTFLSATSSTVVTATASLAQLDTMTITPTVVGTYLVLFNGCYVQTVLTGNVSWAVYVNGVQTADSLMTASPPVADSITMVTHAVVAWTTGAIAIFWSSSGGTTSTSGTHTMRLIRIL